MQRDLFYLFPYSTASRSARDLARAIGIHRYRPQADDMELAAENIVINWGATKLPNRVLSAGTILNPPGRIRTINAKDTFMKAAVDTPGGPTVPPFTKDVETALSWLGEGHEVVGRADLKASGGKGIVFGKDKATFEQFVDCPFFTMYIPKKEEYRVHFVKDQLLDIQQKLLRRQDDAGNPVNPKEVDWRLRNHTNGFIFARNNLNVHPDVIEQAKRAHQMTKLDFGAYDIIFNDTKKKAYVLEVNTAPGLTGQTLENYTKAFKDLIEAA